MKLSKAQAKRGIEAEIEELEPIEVTKRLFAIATTSVKDILTIKENKVELKNLDDIPDHKAYAIKSIRQTRGGITLHMESKLDALTNLAKIFKMFTEGMDFNGGDTPMEFHITYHGLKKEDIVAYNPKKLDQSNENALRLTE